MKTRLVLVDWNDFSAPHVEAVLGDYFDIEQFNSEVQYDKTTTTFVISTKSIHSDRVIEDYVNHGYRLLIVNLWEARPFFKTHELERLENILVILGCQNGFDLGWPNSINVPKWFWYNESLRYCKSDLLRNYQPNRTNTKRFFMPILRRKPFRTRIVKRFNNLLDDAIWSYRGSHKTLEVEDQKTIEEISWDRQFNSTWYDNTYFTISVETAHCNYLDNDEQVPAELFVTEKTFKPIAFHHPFQVLGMRGTLEFLKQIGFETYEHIFDESYDSMPQFDDRLEQVYKNTVNFNVEHYRNPLTKHKIEHNYQLFYNVDKIKTGIKNELIEPMLEWINQ